MPREALLPTAERHAHVPGRQHVGYLNEFRRRLANGVALAKALNRTVVLPPFYCYCDKYWARLVRGTMGQQALRNKPRL